MSTSFFTALCCSAPRLLFFCLTGLLPSVGKEWHMMFLGMPGMSAGVHAKISALSLRICTTSLLNGGSSLASILVVLVGSCFVKVAEGHLHFQSLYLSRLLGEPDEEVLKRLVLPLHHILQTVGNTFDHSTGGKLRIPVQGGGKGSAQYFIGGSCIKHCRLEGIHVSHWIRVESEEQLDSPDLDSDELLSDSSFLPRRLLDLLFRDPDFRDVLCVFCFFELSSCPSLLPILCCISMISSWSSFCCSSKAIITSSLGSGSKFTNPCSSVLSTPGSRAFSCAVLLAVSAAIKAVVRSTGAAFDYADALSKSLLYFEAQRSGRLPYNQRVTWRDHSGLTDGLEQGVDLVGGYYDAGDHVKFGLPMAFTVTMLSWGAIEYAQQIADAGEMEHTMEAIKWGTDYFIKAHTSPNVGDGDTDHYCWQRSEDMTTSRQAFKIDEDNPGSDLAGETAAAMAAASIVFRKTNPHYSHLLLHHAQQLFEFGDKHRGKYDGSVGAVKSYYASVSGYMDELLWGGMWLYKATDNEQYLHYVISNAHAFGGTGWAITEFSWDVKYAALQLIASQFLSEEKHKKHASILEQYRSKAEYYICSCLNQNDIGHNVERTPAGLLYIRQWNNMQYVSTASFLLTVYSDFLQATNQNLTCHAGTVVGPDEIMGFAKSQVDYILGSNPLNMSYLVGFGPNYPKRVHHRGASIVSYRENKGFIGCTQGYDNWYNSLGPNPNVLVGALVGGPDNEDNFMDRRSNYMQTEACTYNTAPLVGVFAKLLEIENQKMVRDSNSLLIASI
ncbi:endoglucanase 11-like [Senna tora]|uniref:Endoglucanase n=1 Tax=Senna tora TaxID=362788 RepID=A0A834T552_9FABA|nr:endoglucanase 11-like [Senna tora]